MLMFRHQQENKLILSRLKLLQYIIHIPKLLCQWNIQSICKLCGQDEDYFHYFIAIPFLDEFWKQINDLLKSHKINMKITLKHLVFGYKITDKAYFDLNYFLTILSFSIYKGYYISEQKTKNINLFKLFSQEFDKRIDFSCKSKMLLKTKQYLNNTQNKIQMYIKIILYLNITAFHYPG